jgi:spore coat protein CotF
MGNSMAGCVLRHMLEYVEDPEIKQVVEHALSLATRFQATIKDIYVQEKYPVPQGFTEQDMNPGAGRLFLDEFCLHYLRYTSKAGMSIYGVAVTLMSRPDIRTFFMDCVNSTMALIDMVDIVLEKKGLFRKPPPIPYPDSIDMVEKQSYLNGFFGKVRPLQALEIAHLHECIENNAISRAVLVGFSQVAQSEQVKAYMRRGQEIAVKHYKIFSAQLAEEHLSTFPILDPLVTASTYPPFSDKLMTAHKLDMFTMRIRSYGNALAFAARHDLAHKYGRLLVEVGNYAEDGANILIDHAWMEQPPESVDRDSLSSE